MRPALRASGYASRFYEWGYALGGPWYDLIVGWGLLPLGGEPRCRRLFASWCRVEPGQRVVSLCCGTGRTEQAILDAVPDVSIVGVDLGRGQLERARRRLPAERVRLLHADASRSGLPDDGFDRAVIAFALHEMPRALRLGVLREARRLCRPGGLVTAIEHGRPKSRLQRVLQATWWFFWLPGNPEAATSRDLQRRGLANEMREAGLHVVAEAFSRPDWIAAVTARRAQ